MIVLPIMALVLSVIATVLAYVYIVPEKKAAQMNKFGKFLHDMLNFKSLIIERILQALYIFTTAFVILIGFCMLFYVDYGDWYGGYGILVMVFGPIVVRLAYESAMMIILLVKNVIQINNKLKNQNEEGNSDSPFVEKIVFPVPSVAVTPSAPAAPVASAPAAPTFCTNCGAPVGDGVFCTSCGAKLK